MKYYSSTIKVGKRGGPSIPQESYKVRKPIALTAELAEEEAIEIGKAFAKELNALPKDMRNRAILNFQDGPGRNTDKGSREYYMALSRFQKTQGICSRPQTIKGN